MWQWFSTLWRRPPAVANDDEAFLALVRVACEDEGVRSTLVRLLVLPSQQRQGALQHLVDHLRRQAAPSELVAALERLLDPDTADKARELIAGVR